MKRIFSILLVSLMLAALLVPFTASAKVTLLSGSEVRNKFDTSKNSVKEVYRSSKGTSLPYRLYVPDDYDPEKSYPLVLFFHGAGERGNDNNAQISAGSVMQRLLLPSEQKNFPCLILAPQCPGNSQWVLSDWGPGVYNHNTMATPVSPYMAAAEELLDKVIKEYSVNEDRLYVTGMSMGGFGTWDIISRNPDKFAAAFPVCGGVDETYLDVLQGFPIWTFHNNNDGIVSSAGTKKAYEILKDAGGIIYDEYNSGAHDAWTAAYSTDGLLAWVFKKTRSVRVSLPEVEGVTFEAPLRATCGKTLTIGFTAAEGYGLAGLTVNGKTYAPEIVTGGEVSITDYDGGEITPIVGKLASISMVVDGGDPVTVPGSFVVGQSVELPVDDKEGYDVSQVKVGDTVITPDENGAYLYTLTDENTTVTVNYTEIEADGSEGDTDTDTKPGDTDVEDKPEGENKDDKKDDSSMVIIVAVIAAAVLIAAVAVIVIFLKKK